MGSATVRTKEQAASILIVEDERIIARDIKLMLEELGYAVSGIASSGDQALALAAQQSSDLVLMDIRIKGDRDGVQTAAQLIERYQLPIVYITAHTDDLTLVRARETEPFGYVTKPITMQDLKIAIAMALTRHRAQRQIEKREEWFRSILRSTKEAIVITDGSGRISFLNQAAEEMTGNEQESALGRLMSDVLEILDENDQPQALQIYNQKNNFQEPQFLIGSIITPDELRQQVLVSIAPLQGEAGAGSVMVLHDISRIQDKQRALQQRNEQLQSFNNKLEFLSYSLTHDLREPMRMVSLYSDMLVKYDQNALSEETREQLKGIKQASLRMGTVMNSLLDYFSASQLDLKEQRPIDANVPLEEAKLNLSAAIRLSNANIEAYPLPVVHAHPTALMLVFQNLIGNAIKYANRESPIIRISAVRDGDFWCFTVADNGEGFDPQQAQRIFELFRRAHGRDKSGSGIGLATCQRLIEQHEGRIWAESKPGEGAHFHFTIPVAEKPGE